MIHVISSHVYYYVLRGAICAAWVESMCTGVSRRKKQRKARGKRDLKKMI